jgi:hypothetical protein
MGEIRRRGGHAQRHGVRVIGSSSGFLSSLIVSARDWTRNSTIVE